MTGVAAKIKEEIREILGIAIFFSTGFCLVSLANHLLTEGTNVQLAGYVRAIIGGFIVAKVLIVVNLLPFFNAFPHKPLIYNIAWKSSLYIAASIVYQYLEPLVKGLFRGAGLAGANHEAMHKLMLPQTWAIQIWISVLLVAFVTVQEIARVLGQGKMRAMFLGEPKKKTDAQKPIRSAA